MHKFISELNTKTLIKIDTTDSTILSRDKASNITRHFQ